MTFDISSGKVKGEVFLWGFSVGSTSYSIFVGDRLLLSVTLNNEHVKDSMIRVGTVEAGFWECESCED